MFPTKYAGDDDIPYPPWFAGLPAQPQSIAVHAMVRCVDGTDLATTRLVIINRIAQTLFELAVGDDLSNHEQMEMFDHFKTVGTLIVNDLNMVITKTEGPEVEARLIPYLP
jgi:hypothetical protein